MFNPRMMNEFFTSGNHRHTFELIEDVRRILKDRYYGIDAGIDAVLLAAVCGYPCLLFGPPGVAKSHLIRDFCRLVGVRSEGGAGRTRLADADVAEESEKPEDREYFEYLLTHFTEPTELFGSFQLEGADGKQKLVRDPTGMLHTCRVAFLDEVFNGSSAILNSLLALMNEGVFHDRGVIRPSRLSMIFGATNTPPDGGSLAAIFDRFVIRAHMGNVEPTSENYRDYLQRAESAQSELGDDKVFKGLLDDLENLVRAFDEFNGVGDSANRLFDWESEAAAAFLENLHFIVLVAREKRLGSFSNRRIVQLTRAICMQRFMRAAREETGGDWSLSFEDYRIIWTHFLDIPRPLDVGELMALETLKVSAPLAGSGP